MGLWIWRPNYSEAARPCLTARAGQNGGKDDLEGSAELEILGQREDAHFRR